MAQRALNTRPASTRGLLLRRGEQTFDVSAVAAAVTAAARSLAETVTTVGKPGQRRLSQAQAAVDIAASVWAQRGNREPD